MPTLVLYSRLSEDSRRLRKAAQALGWDTLRLEGTRLPEWFEPAAETALFMTAPSAFQVADQLGRVLLGCGALWLPGLSECWLRREVEAMPLEQALRLRTPRFIKHSVSKAFEARVFEPGDLVDATAALAPTAILHVAEPVVWEVEYRCFVCRGEVVAISPYRRGALIYSDEDDLASSDEEVEKAREFAGSLLRAVSCPPAFVLDVGLIADRGWAVVEPNECWAAGIYGCNPQAVLPVLTASCVLRDASPEVERWDFARLYELATNPS